MRSGAALADHMLMAMKMLAKADQLMASVMLPHDPAHAERARHWCSVHLVRNELVTALSDCDYAVAHDPSDAAAYSNRGSVWLAANEPARALRDFNEAIALSPGDAGFHFNRGIAHGRLGVSDRALAEPYRLLRRLVGLSQAASAAGSSMAA